MIRTASFGDVYPHMKNTSNTVEPVKAEPVTITDPENRPVNPTILVSLEDITSGGPFIHLAKTFNFMLHNRVNKEETVNALNEIVLFCSQYFNFKAKVSIVESKGEYQFFGFRFFPKEESLKNLSKKIFSNFPNNGENIAKEINDSWRSIKTWEIEIDEKILYDLSNRLTAEEVTTLFIYQVEQNVFNSAKLTTAFNLIFEKFTEPGVNYKLDGFIQKSNPCRELLGMVFLYACNFVNYNTVNNDDFIISLDNRIRERYTAAINKLTARYGLLSLIDRKDHEFNSGCMSVVNWVFESINDLRFSTFRFCKNLVGYTRASQSPYITRYMKNLYREFTSSVGTVYDVIDESAKIMNPIKEKALQENLEAYWRKEYTRITESLSREYLDREGFVIKIHNQDIDEIRVETANITSVADKLYLLERLYKLIKSCEYALELIDDKHEAHRVRQSKEELHRKMDELNAVRMAIIQAPVGKERYGLYIKYPPGYEG